VISLFGLYDIGAGINPAHRNTPLACAPFIPDDAVAAAAAEECSYTHGNNEIYFECRGFHVG
jgi:hypothetical protein